MKRLLITLASVAALAVFSMTPVAAQATPRFYINGVLAGAGKQNAVQFGTITMKSPWFGEIKCNVLVGAPVGNESERGVAPVDGWETWNCRTACRGPAFVMAERPPLLVFREFTTKEEIQRGLKTLPWPAELSATEGRTSLRMGNTEKLFLEPRLVKVWMTCPEELLEVVYEGELEPRIVNGTKNGLKPSHLEFEGEGGKTGFLKTPDLCGGQCSTANLYVKGELTLLGTGQQLITAE
jgi:hypothetical protein